MLQRGTVARKQPAFRCYLLEKSWLPAPVKKLIPARQSGLIFSSVLLFEGRLLETILKAEQRTASGGNAPAATVRT
jgi:hypothetical protein